MHGAEVKVGEGPLLLGGEDEGLGGRRHDGLQARELAVEVADVHRLLDGRQEGRSHLLGQQRLPVDALQGGGEMMRTFLCFHSELGR